LEFRRPDRSFGLAPGAHIGAHTPQADQEQGEREQRRQRIDNRSHIGTYLLKEVEVFPSLTK
jgi:hypothetical protein